MSVAAVLGVVLSLLALYALEPLNNGATTLVIIICFSVAATIVTWLDRLLAKRKEST